MVHPGQASCWYDPHGPHCGLAPTLTHLRTSPWVCLLKGLCLGAETIISVPALEGERSGDNLLVRAVRGRCLIAAVHTRTKPQEGLGGIPKGYPCYIRQASRHHTHGHGPLAPLPPSFSWTAAITWGAPGSCGSPSQHPATTHTLHLQAASAMAPGCACLVI